jgi:colicin import membrane protein
MQLYREADVRRLAAAKWGLGAGLDAARAKAAAAVETRRANKAGRATRARQAAAALHAAGLRPGHAEADARLAKWVTPGKGELGAPVERRAEAERAARAAAEAQRAAEAAARVAARRAAEARRAARLEEVVAALEAAGVAAEEAHALAGAQLGLLECVRLDAGPPALTAARAAAEALRRRDADAALAARGLSASEAAAMEGTRSRVDAFVRGLADAAASAEALAEHVAAAWPEAEAAHRRAAAAVAVAPRSGAARVCLAPGCRNQHPVQCPSCMCGRTARTRAAFGTAAEAATRRGARAKTFTLVFQNPTITPA